MLFEDTRVLQYLTVLWVCLKSSRSLRNSFLNESSHRIWKDAKVSVNRIEGVTEILLLPLHLSASPLGIPNGFGEDVVSPIQIHDPILQVEFPFVLTSVNLQREEEREGNDCCRRQGQMDTVSAYSGHSLMSLASAH